MKQSGIITLFSIAQLLCILLMPGCRGLKQVEMIESSTVATVDIDRYLGTWYEIARFPHSFEKDLAGVTATYSLRKDGKIRVLNQGFKGGLDGKLKKAVGKARIPDPANPSRLQVSFFLFFWSDYLILELDQDDYQWAMIGTGSPNYFWILCRKPVMEDAVYAKLLESARKRGYDLTNLVRVEQAP